MSYSAIVDGRLPKNDLEYLQPLEGITARNVMNTIPAIPQNATLKEAAQQLVEHRITSAPVVSAEGKVIGQLTERDLLKSLTEEKHDDLAAFDVMNSSVVCYPETTSLIEIFQFLIRVSIPHVVVVRNGCPIGVIARSTLLSWIYVESIPTSANSTIPVIAPGSSESIQAASTFPHR